MWQFPIICVTLRSNELRELSGVKRREIEIEKSEKFLFSRDINIIFYVFQVLESIPQIPIHVTEIKNLILKDNPGFTVESCLNEDRLLSILTNGSTGRNPTFFKAYGHEAVFGLRSAIPEGGSTLEVAEDVPKLDAGKQQELILKSL